MIYLDNAATSWPRPENVYQAMDRFLREKGGNPGHGSHSLAAAAKETIDDTRMRVARFINAPEVERVVFTMNCTHSLNMGLKGLLRPGDHLITSRLEHNAVVRPLRKLETQGVAITRLAPSPETGVVSVADLEQAITPQTRLITMIHVSNVNGVIQPIEEYGAIARKHNVPFMVDAAQSAGHYPIDVQAGNIDLLAFSAHKGTYGPPGVGVLYIGEKVNPETMCEGGTGVFSESDEQPEALPYRYESGTQNAVGICGLGAGIEFILTTGRENIASHEHALLNRMIEGLSHLRGVVLYRAVDTDRQAAVISCNINGYEPGEVGVILDQAFDIKVRAGLHCTPEAHRCIGTFPKGTVRLSPGYFNTEEEIDLTIKAISSIAKSKN
ncbi:MAG TPA: cysteine desulfurase [Deltaproteobacteria bacterium]|nr:cysteine desulfurase [Deltaproteobacteria bacterium]